MNIPSKVSIDPALYRKLKECFHEQVAIQKMMQNFIDNCKGRMQINQQKIAETWAAIRAETGVDLQNVVWNPHPTDAAIVPVQMALAQEPTLPIMPSGPANQ